MLYTYIIIIRKKVANTHRQKFRQIPPPHHPTIYDICILNFFYFTFFSKEKVTMKITVWRKEYTNKEGKKFPLYRCKDANGNFYNVKVSEDCSTELPAKKIFVLDVDANGVSTTVRHKINKDTGEAYTDNFLYLRKVNKIEEFVQPDCDVDFI